MEQPSSTYEADSSATSQPLLMDSGEASATSQPLLMDSGEASATDRQQDVSIEIESWSSSSSSKNGGWKYDVFLSFYGEETRKSFVDHLYTALDDKGICVFKDDEKLDRGKPIAKELLKAIEESRYCIPIFSKSYASSTWCLDELAKSIECMKLLGQRIYPVFYGIDPSEVRKQTGDYAVAFAKHEETFKEEMDKMERWRKALFEAASISGWDTRIFANGHEAKCIKQIVEEIIKNPNLGLVAEQKSEYKRSLFKSCCKLGLTTFFIYLILNFGHLFDDNDGPINDPQFQTFQRFAHSFVYGLVLILACTMLYEFVSICRGFLMVCSDG